LWMGVFSIDRGLSTLQAFTTDGEALRQALDRSAWLSPASFTGVRERDAVRKAYGGLATGFGQAHAAVYAARSDVDVVMFGRDPTRPPR